MANIVHVESAVIRALSHNGRPLPGDDLKLIAQVNQALELLHGKWKVHLLFFMARGVHRHSRLLDCLPGTSKKVMIDTLRALERDGLVVRRVFAEVPARVEYALTPLGWTVSEPLMSLAEWGGMHEHDIADARTRSAATGRHAAEPVGAPRLAAA